MNNILLIPPSLSLIEEVLSHLNGNERDYSSYLIVFPGKRPSHFLRKAIAQKEKKGFITPIIFSMDEFIDFIYEEKLKLERRKLEAIDSVAILYEIHKRFPNPLGGHSFMSPDSFLPIGLKIYHDIEEFYIEGITPQRVKEIELFIEEKISEQTLKRLHSLSFLYEQFYKEIEDRQLSTRSTRYHTVSKRIDEIDLSAFKQIIFAGFFALTNSERVLFKAFLKREGTLFIFQNATGIEGKIKDLGVIPEVKGGEREEPLIHFCKSPDTHGQIFGLSGIIKEQLEKKEPLDEKTVIVLPTSETLFPLFHQTLSLLKEDNYNISMGYPLHRTPVFGFFNNLMELITSMDEDRIYVPNYLKFVLHPYTKNIYFKNRSDTTRIMFHTIEEEFTRNRTKTFFTLSDIEEDESLFAIIIEKLSGSEPDIDKSEIKGRLKTIHQNTIKKFLSFENIGDFALKGIEVLTYINEQSTAPLHLFFQPFSEAFIESLHIISNSLIKDIKFERPSGYFNLIRKYIITRHTPFEGTPLKGLQVLGFLETRNLKFNNVFVLDVNEEVIPDIRKEDSLLPIKAREILGLPTYLDREKLIAYYFELLVKGAKEVHLFFVEDDKKEKSRFIEKLLWKIQKKEKKIDTKDYVKSVQYSVKLENKTPEPIYKTVEMVTFLSNYSYSATALDAYLRCPLMFYYNHVLDLGKKEEMSGDIEKVDIGKFVHRVLLDYFKKRKGYQLTEKDVDVQEMDHLIDELFEKDYGKELTGAAYFLKRQIKNQIREFLAKYQLPLIKRQPITILALEHRININKNSFILKGVVDRIEKRGEKIFIIDYKTTGNDDYLKINFDKLNPENRESWNKQIGTLQLPFYLLLYSGKTPPLQGGDKGGVENINSIFLLLGKVRIGIDIELPLFDTPKDAYKNYEAMENIIFSLLEEIVNPKQPFTPTSNMKETCPSCTFQYICGTQWIQKTKH